jgi:ferredoxin-NADP reductase
MPKITGITSKHNKNQDTGTEHNTGEHQWFSAHCIRKTAETSDTFSYEFRPDKAQLQMYAAGAHINVRLPAGKNGAIIERTYTLSSSPKTLPTFSLTVKRVNNGCVSNWLADHLEPGMALEFTQAAGEFVLPEQTPGRLLFIAAGSGITPMMSMLRFLSETANKSEIDCLYYARSPQDIIFHQQLDKLSASMKGLRVNYCVEQTSDDWLGLSGRINAEHFKQLNHLSKYEIYLCGPAPFMDAAGQSLKTLGVADYQIHKEIFAVDMSAHSVQTQAKVQFSGESQASLTTKKTLLDEAESRGLALASGCRSGICKTCRCKKVSGETVNLLNGQRSTAANEYILPCVTQALSDTIIEI